MPTARSLCVAPGFNAWHAAVLAASAGQDRRMLGAHFSPMGFEDDTGSGQKVSQPSAVTSCCWSIHLPREVYVRGAERAGAGCMAEGITGFEIDVVLNENWPHDCRLTAIISVCTACRSSTCSRRSRSVTPFATGKRISAAPDGIQDGHTEIYSVDNIISSRHPAVRRMSPSPAFVTGAGCCARCAGTLLPHAGKARPFRPAYTWLILGGDAFDTDRMLEDERSL